MDVAEKMNSTDAPRRQPQPIPDEVREVRYCPFCNEPIYLLPCLTCRECGEVLRLRCFTYRRGDFYYSECVDLNLMTRGRTMDDAIRRLQEEVFTYLDTVIQGSSKGLLPRRSPLSSRIRYQIYRLRCRLRSFSHRHPDHREIDVRTLGVIHATHC